ncbi:proton-conducting transporter membrane subunit [Tundrisphaera lichenicola]|uniref:proton-conducting transporter transmembrane domain-containing protein n=1 Tax=Tundrisphaera lichenicola TaxID=2029860 RepID=UPI003EB813DD
MRRADGVRAGNLGWVPLAALVALTGFSVAMLAWQVVTPHPARLAGLWIDRLAASLGLLVSAIGAVTYRFSMRYLDGDPGRRRFLRWLGFTVAMAYVLMLASNLVLLFVAWSMTSLGLHKLLTYYGDRPEAWRPARKKFLISRLGDLALVGAILLIGRDWGTTDLHDFLGAFVETGGAGASGIALLVATAALTKSAQFPFHSWLPETMESPTPVSALMHAGIVNAGGALLLRFSPLIVRVPESLLLLSLVGTITACLGMLAMWAQVKVKRTLAWSTVGQMGFMMVQCGLGAFPAAALHMVGHGCYKAWSFLRSGDLPGPSRPMIPASTGWTLMVAAVGTVASLPALGLASRLTGFHPWNSPGELALTAIVALSIGQLWVTILRVSPLDLAGRVRQVIGALVATVAAAVAIFALYQGVASFLHPVLGEMPAPAGPMAWMAATLPVVGLVALVGISAALPTLGRSRAGRAFQVHALQGFYFGAIADRLVDRAWSRFKITGVDHA